MIEAQCDLGLGPGNKFFFLFIPERGFFSGPQAKQQCLVRQRDWRAPFHSKSPKVRNGRNAAGLHVRRDASLSAEIDELLVFRREIGKRSFVGRPNHRHHDSILGFNGDAHINGV